MTTSSPSLIMLGWNASACSFRAVAFAVYRRYTDPAKG